MYDDLQVTIQKIVGEGQAEDIIDIFYAFEEIAYQDHIFLVQDAMACREDLGNDWFIETIRTICIDNITNIIKSMGVIFDEDHSPTMAMLLQVFTCLVRIERYPYKGTIYYAIDNADTTIDAFDEILAIFHGEDYQSIVDYFGSVSPDLIEKLKAICIEDMKLHELEVPETAPLSKEFLSLLSVLTFYFLETENTLYNKLAEGSLLITMPMSVFYNEMVRNIIDICEIESVRTSGRDKYMAISKLIFTYATIAYIKDSKSNSLGKDLASKIYALIDTLQEDVIQLDESIEGQPLSDAMVQTFTLLSGRLEELSNESA